MGVVEFHRLPGLFNYIFLFKASFYIHINLSKVPIEIYRKDFRKYVLIRKMLSYVRQFVSQKGIPTPDRGMNLIENWSVDVNMIDMNKTNQFKQMCPC